jgi:hypothetical protein
MIAAQDGKTNESSEDRYLEYLRQKTTALGYWNDEAVVPGDYRSKRARDSTPLIYNSSTQTSVLKQHDPERVINIPRSSRLLCIQTDPMSPMKVGRVRDPVRASLFLRHQYLNPRTLAPHPAIAPPDRAVATGHSVLNKPPKTPLRSSSPFFTFSCRRNIHGISNNMTTEAAARAFFSAPYFAVVGASSDPTKFGHKSASPSIPQNLQSPSEISY